MASAASRSRAWLASIRATSGMGSGAPALVDMLGALSTWVEQGRAPGALRVVAG